MAIQRESEIMMKKRKILLWIALILAVLLVALAVYAVNHLGTSVLLQKYILYTVGALYLVAMLIIFKNQFSNRNR